MTNQFGMFIHWGIYAQTGIQEQVFAREDWDRARYERLAQTFCPSDYDPEAWVLLAKRAGMKAEYLHFDENQRDALAESVKAKLHPGDCVLLKGSNSMKLGEVAARLLKD